MARIGDQGGGVADQAAANLDGDDGQIERDSDPEPPVAGRGVDVVMMSGVPVGAVTMPAMAMVVVVVIVVGGVIMARMIVRGVVVPGMIIFTVGMITTTMIIVLWMIVIVRGVGHCECIPLAGPGVKPVYRPSLLSLDCPRP